LSEAYPKSEAVSGPNLDEHKPNSSANDHRYVGLNVKIVKSIESFDGPNFDLGI